MSIVQGAFYFTCLLTGQLLHAHTDLSEALGERQSLNPRKEICGKSRFLLRDWQAKSHAALGSGGRDHLVILVAVTEKHDFDSPPFPNGFVSFRS